MTIIPCVNEYVVVFDKKNNTDHWMNEESIKLVEAWAINNSNDPNGKPMVVYEDGLVTAKWLANHLGLHIKKIRSLKYG